MLEDVFLLFDLLIFDVSKSDINLFVWLIAAVNICSNNLLLIFRTMVIFILCFGLVSLCIYQVFIVHTFFCG